MVASAACVSLVLRWDERRLSADQLARAWPPATRLFAIWVAGVLCLPLHFARTRRSLRGLFLGIFAAVAASVAVQVLSDVTCAVLVGQT